MDSELELHTPMEIKSLTPSACVFGFKTAQSFICGGSFGPVVRAHTPEMPPLNCRFRLMNLAASKLHLSSDLPSSARRSLSHDATTDCLALRAHHCSPFYSASDGRGGVCNRPVVCWNCKKNPGCKKVVCEGCHVVQPPTDDLNYFDVLCVP